MIDVLTGNEAHKIELTNFSNKKIAPAIAEDTGLGTIVNLNLCTCHRLSCRRVKDSSANGGRGLFSPRDWYGNASRPAEAAKKNQDSEQTLHRVKWSNVES
jgi:hypothetical protein